MRENSFAKDTQLIVPVAGKQTPFSSDLCNRHREIPHLAETYNGIRFSRGDLLITAADLIAFSTFFSSFLLLFCFFLFLFPFLSFRLALDIDCNWDGFNYFNYTRLILTNRWGTEWATRK